MIVAVGWAGTGPLPLYRLNWAGWQGTARPSWLHLWWRADGRRRWTAGDLPDAEGGTVAYVLGGGLAVGWPGRRRRGADHARLVRFLTHDPLAGVTITWDDPIVTVTLAPSASWTAARVRAATLELRHLGAGLTLTYRGAQQESRGGRPSDVRCAVAGCSVVDWWGDATTRSWVVPRREIV